MVRTTPTGKDPNVVYSLGHSAGEQLSAASGPRTVPSKRRLGRLDRPGARRGPVSMPGVADGILDLLAERVGPGGTAVGLDAARNHVAMATQSFLPSICTSPDAR